MRCLLWRRLLLVATLVLSSLLTTATVLGGGGGNSSPWRDHELKQQEQRYRGRNDEDTKGPRGKDWGQAFFERGMYEEAAPHYWTAVLFHSQTPSDLTYDVQDVFGKFLQCFTLQGKTVDGLAYVSMESFRRGQRQMGESFLAQALDLDPNNEQALAVKREFLDKTKTKEPSKQQQASRKPKLESQQPVDATSSAGTSSSSLANSVTPEELYEMASKHFLNKDYEACADLFELSCQQSDELLGPSCANAVYCRTMIVDWGFNGTQFEADMNRIAQITLDEAMRYRHNIDTRQNKYLDVVANDKDVDSSDSSSSSPIRNFGWQRATSVHPHMMLGYPLENLLLKRYVAEAVAYMDEMMARASQGLDKDNRLPPLPDDMPFPTDPQPWIQEKLDTATKDPASYRIRVGFVGSGFNSKAVLYLSHDMFRFFDTDIFEIHAFSFAAPDSPYFIQYGMRGVDWRKRVQSNVHQFHDLRHLVNDHIAAARYVRKQGIHILIEWDGYARQGERAQGLFGLRPAPIQMLHQEYLGTSGALYVDYHFTDKVTSPVMETQQYFTEKLIYLPNHFFSKGHAMQAEVMSPTYDFKPRGDGGDEGEEHASGYRLGTGTPQENRCLAPPNVGPTEVSFVFCNWNKLLKNNPQTVRSWIRILRQVPNSILCLLENPSAGTDYFRKFVHETAGTSKGAQNTSSDHNNNNYQNRNPWADFEAGDGDELNSRIHFLPWEKNPFDHQRRNFDFCNVMLDSFPYNAHTVAQDSLYAGVPIVTRSDGWDMSARVTTSANVVLGLDKVLNAYQGPKQYEDMAITLATNTTLFQETRTKLIDACLERNPMHPYWDVARYVKNFEQGLLTAWDTFLKGKPPQHIFIQETAAAQRGTYDDEILAHPPLGPNPTHDE
ncbi:hypothetical protein ACA910_020252 [Epithemia clementina (nom. ined.)]